jgi:dTDP-4-amino-4,6-dideoxygalactose transaminase
VPSAVVHAHATPVLVEMTEDLVIDCDDLERKITRRTKALLLSYMRGRVPDLDRVVEICERRGIALIEDAAHGLGVTWRGRHVGHFGRSTAFSFQSYKLLDAGEGGMFVTNDREVALRAILLSGCTEQHWQQHFLSDEDGAWLDAHVNSFPVYAFRMTNLQGAALLPQLDHIEDRVAEHNRIYERMCERLSVSSHIRVPGYLPEVRFVPDTIQFELPDLRGRQLERFVEIARDKDVPVDIFGLGATNARCFWNWTFFDANDCPHTRAMLARTVDLRLPLALDDRIFEYFADVILASAEDAAATAP